MVQNIFPVLKYIEKAEKQENDEKLTRYSYDGNIQPNQR